jgi:ABC-type transport system involved in multi-copper enzyme maturation permease subunit
MSTTIALIRDTFREALARKIFWGLYGLSTFLILFFLFVLKIDIVEGAIASVSLFGATADRTVDVDRLVRQVYAGIATFLFTWGTLIAVFASAGLVPSVLEPGRIELLLSKPVTRSHILLGRYLGNLLVVAANSVYLVLGIWTILGIKTGIWSPSFLWAIVLTIFVFSVFLTVVVWIGVAFESAALATMISVGIAILSAILAQHQIVEKLLSSEWSRQLWRALYYVLPKFYDLGDMTRSLVLGRPIDSLMPLWSSAIFAAVVLVWSLQIFARRDF